MEPEDFQESGLEAGSRKRIPEESVTYKTGRTTSLVILRIRNISTCSTVSLTM